MLAYGTPDGFNRILATALFTKPPYEFSSGDALRFSSIIKRIGNLLQFSIVI